MTMKFKVGDRIRNVSDDGYRLPIGYETTLIEVGGYSTIKFRDEDGDMRQRKAGGYELVTAAPPAPLDLTALKAGDTVTIRAEVLRANPDCDGFIMVEAGSAGLHFHVDSSAIISIERTVLTIGDRVTDGTYIGPIVFQDGGESVFKHEGSGIFVRRTADLVLAQ